MWFPFIVLLEFEEDTLFHKLVRFVDLIVREKKFLSQKLTEMQFKASSYLILLSIFAIACCVYASMEDTSQNMYSYGRSVDAELIARLLQIPPRYYHPKRNSELINSLLSLPQKMNNAGK